MASMQMGRKGLFAKERPVQGHSAGILEMLLLIIQGRRKYQEKGYRDADGRHTPPGKVGGLKRSPSKKKQPSRCNIEDGGVGIEKTAGRSQGVRGGGQGTEM